MMKSLKFFGLLSVLGLVLSLEMITHAQTLKGKDLPYSFQLRNKSELQYFVFLNETDKPRSQFLQEDFWIPVFKEPFSHESIGYMHTGKNYRLVDNSNAGWIEIQLTPAQNGWIRSEFVTGFAEPI